MREKMARRLQRWWRRLRRQQQQTVRVAACEQDLIQTSDLRPHSEQDLIQTSDLRPHSEQDLIQTVLMKYETLQRQSRSLVYSYSGRNSRRWDVHLLLDYY